MSQSASLLQALDAFYLEHRLCGELTGDVEERADTSALVWLVCSVCDARIMLRV